MDGIEESGKWVDWKECTRTTLAVGIVAKTNMLKLEGLGPGHSSTEKMIEFPGSFGS